MQGRSRHGSRHAAIAVCVVSCTFLLVTLPLHAAATASGGSAAEAPMLLRNPALGRTEICFSHGGDLWLVGRDGGEARCLPAGPGEETDPTFSPDGSLVAFIGEYEGNYETPWRTFDPAWSPDSRFLAYTRLLPNHLHAVCVYAVETGKESRISDGLSDARYAAWDPDGKHLYFTASTDAGPAAAWLDMSRFERPVTRSIYAAVLRRDLPSPAVPQSDDE